MTYSEWIEFLWAVVELWAGFTLLGIALVVMLWRDKR